MDSTFRVNTPWLQQLSQKKLLDKSEKVAKLWEVFGAAITSLEQGIVPSLPLVGAEEVALPDGPIEFDKALLREELFVTLKAVARPEETPDIFEALLQVLMALVALRDESLRFKTASTVLNSIQDPSVDVKVPTPFLFAHKRAKLAPANLAHGPVVRYKGKLYALYCSECDSNARDNIGVTKWIGGYIGMMSHLRICHGIFPTDEHGQEIQSHVLDGAEQRCAWIVRTCGEELESDDLIKGIRPRFTTAGTLPLAMGSGRRSESPKKRAQTGSGAGIGSPVGHVGVVTRRGSMAQPPTL